MKWPGWELQIVAEVGSVAIFKKSKTSFVYYPNYYNFLTY